MSNAFFKVLGIHGGFYESRGLNKLRPEQWQTSSLVGHRQQSIRSHLSTSSDRPGYTWEWPVVYVIIRMGNTHRPSFFFLTCSHSTNTSRLYLISPINETNGRNNQRRMDKRNVQSGHRTTLLGVTIVVANSVVNDLTSNDSVIAIK